MEKFVLLPVLYDSWPHLRDDLKSLAGKTIRGLDALEEVLVKNDRSGNIHLPLTLLRSALNREQVCTLGHFCDVLLPWMACTALNVEHLFRDSEYKLKVDAINIALSNYSAFLFVPIESSSWPGQ